MAKASKQFKAYDLRRKNQHVVPTSAVQTQQYQLDEREWAASLQSRPSDSTRSKTKANNKKGRISKRAPAKKAPKRAFDVLRASDFDECLQCGQTGDDTTCSAKCHQKFRKQYVADQIDIKGPSQHGYGAFTKPGVTISKGAYLDEYVGDVRPVLDHQPYESLYCFYVPDGSHRCYIDAEKIGNWTRFINSHCKPNLRPFPTCVGRRHVIVFEALRDIGPEEELTFYYQKAYFKAAGFDCGCDAYKKAHVPRE